MNRMKLIPLLAALCLIFVAACEKPAEEEAASAAPEETAQVEEAPVEEAAPESPLVKEARELAALRAKIEANPDQVEALLAEAKMTEEELAAKIFEISADPAARAAYAESAN
ncbi:hypothetical protein [Lujinxingia litoralis]|uniref:hypothetical protein n=1 Tax=Lujinxingia litoralis TaxID=2211119 RepID=UPI00131421AE|nr:hypothetical protein [Lujinxingia litoralis]